MSVDASKSDENQLQFSRSSQSFEKVKFTRSYRSRSMTQEQIEAEIEEYEAERLLSKNNDRKEDLV